MKKILIILTLLILFSCNSYYSEVDIYMGDFSAVSSNKVIINKHLNKNSIDAKKTGTACITNILGLVAIGDSSIEAAKNNADITKITFVTTSNKIVWNYLPLFKIGCTIVKGE